jgi:single-strand DNA-binding protein
MKHLPSGHSITSFSIALNTGTKDKPRTCWVECKAWNQPESALDMLRKGAAITVTGRLDSESWEDKKTGEKKTKTVVVADLVHVPIWEKRERQEQSDGLVSQPRSSRLAAQVDHDDVPF